MQEYIAATLIMLLSIAGCAPVSAEMNLTEGDSGTTITLSPGQEIAVNFDSNPTTGYMWAFIQPPDEQVLKFLATTYTIPKVHRVGAGRKETWRFRAAGKGNTYFKLAYFRSFEPDKKPLYEFELTVVVK